MTLPPPTGWFALGARGVLAGVPYDLARRAPFPIITRNGVTFGWHHPAGAPPAWDVPELDQTGWRPLRHRVLEARTHPQEVYENSIDTAHFPVIHGYREIETTEPMRLDGHQMRVGYAIARHGMRARFTVHLHGLGVAHNHIEVPRLGLRVRMLALATPTTPGRVAIRLAVSVARSRWLAPILPLIHRGVAREIVHDFCQDIAIWEHKRFVRPPLLVKGDGPIESFRRWSRQFYPAGS